MDCISGGSEPTEWTASPAPAATATIAIAARYSILMAMVPPSGPRTNWTLPEMFQSAHLILSAIAAVALLTAASTMPRSYSPSTERHAAAAAIGHCKNFPGLPGTKAAELGANDPIFCAASSSMRRLGAPIASSRPNGVTIRSQGTKAPVKTLEVRDRRSPLTTRRMSRIANGSYCRARCCHKQALAQIAKSGGLRFRCQPCSQTGELREGWTPILARSYPNEAPLCATAST